jgi:hypothetical protein
VTVVALVAVAACGSESRTSNEEPYSDASDRWRDAGLSGYTITYFVTGGVGRVGPKAVQVVNAEAVEVDTSDPTQLAPSFSVADFFDEINAADVVVSADFDADLGYPTQIDLDPIENAIDDEFSVEVVSLEPAD